MSLFRCPSRLRPRTMFSVFSVVFSESLLNRNDQHGSGSEAR